MSAINMTCKKCGQSYLAGVVGTTPWPAHVCPSQLPFDAGYAQAIRDVVEWLRAEAEGLRDGTIAGGSYANHRDGAALSVESRFSAPSPEESE